ncbi:testis-expressed protein 30 [Coregonus clupeaformis]|uniref:testis-expressed protein 30 n=1 Tax=Coregonus clupeaformis TaxID=59861 RepID=UPI001BDF8DF3|nr:testis-expressed protein 30 [Coregonus clupeaformis]
METIQEDSMTIPFGAKHLVAVLSIPANSSDVQTAVILTHGAGGDMNFKHLVSLAHALSSNGLLCLRFTCKGLNLVYRVKAYHAVWEYAKLQVTEPKVREGMERVEQPTDDLFPCSCHRIPQVKDEL